MFVQASWMSASQDEDALFGTMSAAWATKSNLVQTLQQRQNGNKVQFRSGDDLLMIGGRSSMPDELAGSTIQNLDFAPAQGEQLMVVGRRKTHEKGRLLSALPKVALGLLTNPSRWTTNYFDKLGKLLDVGTDTFTLVHVISTHPGPDDYDLPGTPSGAQLANLLRHFFTTEL